MKSKELHITLTIEIAEGPSEEFPMGRESVFSGVPARIVAVNLVTKEATVIQNGTKEYPRHIFTMTLDEQTLTRWKVLNP